MTQLDGFEARRRFTVRIGGLVSRLIVTNHLKNCGRFFVQRVQHLFNYVVYRVLIYIQIRSSVLGEYRHANFEANPILHD